MGIDECCRACGIAITNDDDADDYDYDDDVYDFDERLSRARDGKRARERKK